jgi:hypothetical protein
MKNQLLIIEENNKEIMLMYCEKDTIIKLCEIDQLLLKGCDEYIQYMNLIYYLITIFHP